MDTIQDLLPNEHLLNFYEGVVRLPDWLGHSLKIILGAGDLDQEDKLNIEKFSMFDVFFCEPWDSDGSLRKNIEYLLKYYNHHKVICFIDYTNQKQVDSFCSLFKNRFSLVDGYAGHTPHLPFDCIEEILEPGGTAINLFEFPPTVFIEQQLINICNADTKSLHEKDGMILLGRLSLYEISNPKNRKIVEDSYSDCLLRHAWRVSQKSPIEVDWIMLTDVEGIDRINMAKFILGVLLLFPRIPTKIKAEIKQMNRIWNPLMTKSELVFTKIAEGGKRKVKKTYKLK